jgi:PAS domain S-box-containing protein
VGTQGGTGDAVIASTNERRAELRTPAAVAPRPRSHRSSALTPRQREILERVARGLRTRDIAREIGISERAVTAHITRLLAAFGLPNRSALIAAVVAPAGSVVALAAREHARYDAAPFLVAVTVGRDHEFVYVNRMWERVMGLRSAEVVGRTVRAVFPNASASTYAARLRAYREGRPSTGAGWHYRWAQADGSVREADFNFIHQPLHDRSGAVVGVMLIATESLG